MLMATPGVVSYELLRRSLKAHGRHKNAHRCVHAVISKTRKRLTPGEHIENVRGLGYRLVRAPMPRAA